MPMHSISSTVLTGPTNLMAMGHPFVAPAYNDVPGIPIGIDIRSRELCLLDLWRLKDIGFLGSLFGLFLGPKGWGKSATMKILAFRLMTLAAGYMMMRVSINDYKPEGKASEYEAFTRACRSKVFKINELSFNPLESQLFMLDDEGLYELGLISIAEKICAYLKGAPLDGDEPVALRVAIYTMVTKHDELVWSIPLLFKLLRSIETGEIMAYYRDLDHKLLQQLRERLGKLTDEENRRVAEEAIRATMYKSDNVDYNSVKRAGVYVASLLHQLLKGTYGNMIGVKHSLYELLTQPVVTKDWRGVSPEAETLMRIIDNGIKTNAIEKNRLDLLPHIELDDEKHKPMDNIVYARGDAYFSEIARATHTAQLSATHRLSSIRKGGVGSELYGLGNSIISNMGFVAISRQDNDPAVLDELRQRYTLSGSDTRTLAVLPKYTFGLKLGEEERIRFIRIFATPLEMSTFLATDSATDRMVDRPDILNPEDLAQFAEKNGFIYLGEPLVA